MTKNELINAARKAAAAATLDPALVCAIVEQESNWNPWALRFEPTFFTQYVAPLALAQKLSSTESNARATSWGLMQVMGQVARENGFAGSSLAEMCDPIVGLGVGCQVFAAKISKAKQDVERALLLWNGGANTDYPKQVLAHVEAYRNE